MLESPEPLPNHPDYPDLSWDELEYLADWAGNHEELVASEQLDGRVMEFYRWLVEHKIFTDNP